MSFSLNNDEALRLKAGGQKPKIEQTIFAELIYKLNKLIADRFPENSAKLSNLIIRRLIAPPLPELGATGIEPATSCTP